jgi:hypothetical protein
MTTINRRLPGKLPASNVQNQAQSTQKFNERMRYVQGFRYAVTGSTQTTQKLVLNSPGKMLLGLTLIPVSAADISDIGLDFKVNNNNLLIGLSANNLNPSYVQGMIYYPLPQPLQGNDSIQATFNKSNAGDITIYLNVYYLPQ